MAALAASAAENHVALTFDPGPFPWKFVAYGDMRMTDPSNHHDTDPARRKAIIDAIAQQHAKFVVITGDLVLSGGNGNDWTEFDKEIKPIYDSGATIYPALGNHEMHGDQRLGLANYFQRFQQLKDSRYYTVKAGNVLLVTIDSEQDDPKSPERKWLEGVMKTQVTRDIQFVVFSLHHPPYTHFGLASVGHEARHQEKDMAGYLEKLQQKSKAKFLVLAGHNHNYERYTHGGVMYIVTGGGGATPYMPHRDPTDYYQGVGPTYHYCLITMESGKLNFEMYKLDEKLGIFTWEKADNFAMTVQ
jgi:Icc-related predicted phosphoesterase